MPCCVDDTCPVEILRYQMLSYLKDIKDILITIVHSDDNYDRKVISRNTTALIEKLNEDLIRSSR